MDLKNIKELYQKGIVSHSGLKRAEIYMRFKEIKGDYGTLTDAYKALSKEFYLSELRIRDIIRNCKE